MTDKTDQTQEHPIESWKEIAAYLKRDVRTVIRWEKTEGLPVHRQVHQARSSVFAYHSELENWKASRILKLSAPPPISPWRRAASTLSFSLAMLLALISMASGPILNPSIASAQGIVNRQVWAGPDVNTWGKTSADGRSLTITDNETGDLAIRDLATGEKRHLTPKGDWSEWAEGSVLSPDGKQVAFVWFTDMFELRVMGLDGSKPRTLVRDESITYFQPLAWSLDGKQVLATLFPKGNISQIVSVSVVDGSTKILKAIQQPRHDMPRVAVSPDGRYLAYDVPQTDNPSHHNIFYLSVDGRREGPLMEHPADDYPLAWSPDGKTLLFSSDRSGQQCLWTIEGVDGKPQRSPRMLKSGVGDIKALGMTPNGAFYYSTTTGIREIYTAAFDFETGKLLDTPVPVTQLFAGRNGAPDWSPDGSRLAYLSVRRRPPQGGFAASADTIVIRSLATHEEREINPQLAVMRGNPGMRWSSDSGSLIVYGSDENGKDGIFQVDAQTGKVTTLLESKAAEGVYRVAATPDNKVLAFTRNDPSQKFNSVRLRNLKTGNEREIVGGPKYGFIHGFAISPNGSQLAFTTVGEEGGSSVLRVVPLAGGTPREILRLQMKNSFFRAGSLGWTRDGRYLIFARRKGGLEHFEAPLEKVSVAGGEPQLLDMPPMEGIAGLRIHPDGRRVVFGAGSTSEEVWVMENFLPALRGAK